MRARTGVERYRAKRKAIRLTKLLLFWLFLATDFSDPFYDDTLEDLRYVEYASFVRELAELFKSLDRVVDLV